MLPTRAGDILATNLVSNTTVEAGLQARAEVYRHSDYGNLDQQRLRELLESAFERSIGDYFFLRQPLAIYLEPSYRGAAIVEPGLVAPFLTKFAVARWAQGAGVGRGLWQALVESQQSFYWRARSSNPISSWYQQLCDGHFQTERWVVFWRALAPPHIALAVADALGRADDFEG